MLYVCNRHARRVLKNLAFLSKYDCVKFLSGEASRSKVYSVYIIYGPIRIKLINQSRPFPAGIVPSVVDALLEYKPTAMAIPLPIFSAVSTRTGLRIRAAALLVYVHLQIRYLCLLRRDLISSLVGEQKRARTKI